MLEEITPAIVLLYSFSLLILLTGWAFFCLRSKISRWVLSVEKSKLLNQFIFLESEMKQMPFCAEKEKLYEQTVILKTRILELNGAPQKSKNTVHIDMPDGVTSIFSAKNKAQNKKVS
ncbi:hypothetical protein AN214_04038 [Pseudoalteromonas sp. P1-9]|uniref:hypothetical protein n=1 Tax=Pseudoalteromonas sp. P1-9 TaxID=1710354 RepID=UPI0006D63D83|nr:hypothetical protein [Pseudoalteromonas sp. P1-9]KPV93939.1 hypothetical protein AN214_04038 [Pseudoalteromonas sp. P1-9]